MRVLVIGSHPDDEILGCGGTMAKYKNAGAIVETWIADKGRGDPIDQRFDTLPILDWIQLIEAKIKEYQPHVVFTHWPNDLNVDHRVISEATQVACRPQSGVRELYAYESLSSSEHSLQGFRPDTYVVLTEQEAGQKADEMELFYKHEMEKYPHPRSREGIFVAMRYRGLQIHKTFAEGFVTMRRVIYGQDTLLQTNDY